MTMKEVDYQTESEDSMEEVEEEDEFLEMVTLRPKISVPTAGGVETILNLTEWVNSPYQLESDL